MSLTKVTYSMIQGSPVNVLDFGAVSGQDCTAAFTLAAATGKPVYMPYGEYTLSTPVTFTSGLYGAGQGSGKTIIILTGTGQLVVGDWYCDWQNFEMRSDVVGITYVKNPGMSYWSFTNFLINRISTTANQVGIEFDTSTASIYFNRIDDFVFRVDYPVNIKGASAQVFNANKLGSGVGGNKWFDFLSAITIEPTVLACDANQFSGYFEAGVNVLSFNGVALRQNRFDLILDNVVNAMTTTVALTDVNEWKILAGDFVVVGGYPQNQILVGPATTKVFATNSAADSIANATATILKYNSEVFDTLSEFVNGTGIFTARNARYYQITASALSASVAWGIGERWEIQIFKNGTLYMSGDYSTADAASTIQRGSKVSAVVYMNGTTDTLDSRVVHNQGGPVLLDTAPTQNTIQIIRVS